MFLRAFVGYYVFTQFLSLFFLPQPLPFLLFISLSHHLFPSLSLQFLTVLSPTAPSPLSLPPFPSLSHSLPTLPPSSSSLLFLPSLLSASLSLSGADIRLCLKATNPSGKICLEYGQLCRSNLCVCGRERDRVCLCASVSASNA
jgi:hypothetical protein